MLSGLLSPKETAIVLPPSPPDGSPRHPCRPRIRASPPQALNDEPPAATITSIKLLRIAPLLAVWGSVDLVPTRSLGRRTLPSGPLAQAAFHGDAVEALPRVAHSSVAA